MRKVYLTCLGLIIPFVGYASNILRADNNILIYGLFGALLFILVVLIWIFIDAKKNNIQTNHRPTKEEGELINNNLELRQEVVRLKSLLSEKENTIESLNNQIELLSKAVNNYKTDSLNVSNEREEQQKDKTDKNDKVDTTSRNQSEGQSVNVELTVKNGNLVKVESNDTVYYCSWKRKGKLYFKFVNNDRTRKAINNRTVIIDPFCIKQEGSKSPDLSEEIETVVPGQLNDDYTILKKAEIIYK